MLELIITFAIGWILGWKINDALRTTAVRHLLKELGVTDKDLRAAAARNGIQIVDAPDTAAEDLVEIKLEQQGTEIFAYRKSDHQFLAQGSDADSLIARLNQNLTPCKVVVAQEDGADLLQKNNT
jgi:PP-loop superfamily ATP-utilizing enzyme